MTFNQSKLKGRIVEVCGTQGNFAKLMGLSCRTTLMKLKGRVYFKQNEIFRALEILKIPKDSIIEYFFTLKS